MNRFFCRVLLKPLVSRCIWLCLFDHAIRTREVPSVQRAMAGLDTAIHLPLVLRKRRERPRHLVALSSASHPIADPLGFKGDLVK